MKRSLADLAPVQRGTADQAYTRIVPTHALPTPRSSSADIQLTGAEGQPTPVTHLAWSASNGRVIAGGGAFAAAFVVDSATGDVVGPPLSFESFSTGATSVGFEGECRDRQRSGGEIRRGFI